MLALLTSLVSRVDIDTLLGWTSGPVSLCECLQRHREDAIGIIAGLAALGQKGRQLVLHNFVNQTMLPLFVRHPIDRKSWH